MLVLVVLRVSCWIAVLTTVACVSWSCLASPGLAWSQCTRRKPHICSTPCNCCPHSSAHFNLHHAVHGYGFRLAVDLAGPACYPGTGSFPCCSSVVIVSGPQLDTHPASCDFQAIAQTFVISCTCTYVLGQTDHTLIALDMASNPLQNR